MIPAIHPLCNHQLSPAPGDEATVGTLPIMVHERGVACFWLPTTQELYALNRGDALCISMALDLTVTRFPPISVGIPGEMFDMPAPPVATCRWTEDTDGNWDTECGHTFTFIAGSPEENGQVFCCHCGSRITVADAEMPV